MVQVNEGGAREGGKAGGGWRLRRPPPLKSGGRCSRTPAELQRREGSATAHWGTRVAQPSAWFRHRTGGHTRRLPPPATHAGTKQPPMRRPNKYKSMLFCLRPVSGVAGCVMARTSPRPQSSLRLRSTALLPCSSLVFVSGSLLFRSWVPPATRLPTPPPRPSPARGAPIAFPRTVNIL